MSKIYDALNQNVADVPEAVLSALEELRPPSSVPIETPSPQVTTTEPRPSGNTFSTVSRVEPPLQMHVDSAQAPTPQNRTASLSIQGVSPLFPFEASHSYAAEQYRIIRTRLLHHPRSPRVIAVSSSTPGDGKSTTAINLAAAFGLKVRTSTLLLDADFRRSSVHVQLGLPQSAGLAEVLQGKCSLEEAIIAVKELPNLFILTAGSGESNPAELLDSPNWKVLCARLRTLFDYVIVDSVPVPIMADFDLIQNQSDGVVLVVRPDWTSKSVYKRAAQRIPKDKFLGVVMNCSEEWVLWPPSKQHEYYGKYLAVNANGKPVS